MTEPESRLSREQEIALDLEATGISAEPVTQWKLFWTRFTHHRLAMIAALVLGLIVLAAFLAPLIPGLKDPLEQFADPTGRSLNNLPPREGFLFGTDQIGRDLLARVVYGGRTSLIVAGVTGLLVASIGTVVGAVSGYFGGVVDQALMRFTDLVLSLPLLPVAIVAARIFGGTLLQMALLLGLLLWGSLARIVRAEFLSLREKEFVEAARAAGAGDRRIIFRHILPNAVSPIIVQSTLIIGTAIILEAALSFLGFGVRPPTPAWGRMAAEGGRLAAQGFWWAVVFPSVALILTVLSVNFLGDGLRDALDPKQRVERQ